MKFKGLDRGICLRPDAWKTQYVEQAGFFLYVTLMTRTIATGIAILLCFSAQAQSDDTEQLYALALKTFVTHLIKDAKSSEKGRDFTTDTIFFENNTNVKLPLKIGSHVIWYCNDSTNKCVFEGHSCGMNAVWPIQVSKGEISIPFCGYIGHWKDGLVYRALTGGTLISFVYDHAARRYKVKKITDWGI